MTRAAILIGVKKTGTLPELEDAVNGAKRMEKWALRPPQSMKREHVLLFTDESGPVDIGAIRRAIRRLVDEGTIKQMIVYFAGHGVNIRYGEYWLLSDAPEDPSAAVNLDGSVVLARHCGIPHVVFISDACRTAAEGVQAGGITGGEIFPNDPVPGPEASVDIFFGTTLGRPALEVKSKEASSNAFEAIYTNTLLKALEGKLPAALTIENIQERSAHVVRPRPLKACLFHELPRQLAALQLSAEVSQIPDARITSDDNAWLVRFDHLVEEAVTRSGRIGSPSSQTVLEEDVLNTPLGQALERWRVPSSGRHEPGFPNDKRMPERPSPPWHEDFDTHCGVQIIGSTISEVICTDTASADILRPNAAQVRIVPGRSFSNVLLVLGDGSSVFLPMLPDRVGIVTIKSNEGVTDVSFEPTKSGMLWPRFATSAYYVRHLRILAAIATRENSVRINARLADELLGWLRYDGHVDPTLALYAAYALHDAGLPQQLRDLTQALQADVGSAFFDIALLSGSSMADASALRVPLLARGWALLRAFGLLAPEIDTLRLSLRDSLWTHFNEDGSQQLRHLISTGRLS